MPILTLLSKDVQPSVFHSCPSGYLQPCWTTGQVHVPSAWQIVWINLKEGSTPGCQWSSTFDLLLLPPVLANFSLPSWSTGCCHSWFRMVSLTRVFKRHCTWMCRTLHQAGYSDQWAHHKSLAVCWLDLKNAYGSVHHHLISPSNIMVFLLNLRLWWTTCTLTSRPQWAHSRGLLPIYMYMPFKKGVFQGDPLSVTIFNTVMNTCTYIDAVKPLLTSSYHFSKSTWTLGLLQYVDYTCLVLDGPASCQAM